MSDAPLLAGRARRRSLRRLPETAPTTPTGPWRSARPESLGGLLLILAGLVAAVSLVLHWLHRASAAGPGAHGLRRLPRGLLPAALAAAGDRAGRRFLFLLGLALWLPARSHRFVGSSRCS